MEKSEQRLVIGSLLHDFGKLLYRYNDGRNHSTSGYEYLKGISELKSETDILNCVRYHHYSLLGDASVERDALCYITYIADNIASATDRRSREDGKGGFVREVAFESIFNMLNDNDGDYVHRPNTMTVDSIDYPIDRSASEIKYDDSFYAKIVDNIRDALRGIELSDKYINSILQLLEANLINIPSSTNMGEMVDISLYDHVKLTAAFALCIRYYLEEKGERDYKTVLYKSARSFYSEKAFRLYSIDLSGIQSFIYNIGSKSALKGLRARSFYLELLLESAVDELLTRLGLCRANVLYTGGGHTYILAPSTLNTERVVHAFITELNTWLRENFDIGLYAAAGYADCSSDDLKNEPSGSYKAIFENIGRTISHSKLHRYGSEEVISLNSHEAEDYSRECVICHRMDRLNDENECILCFGLKQMSDMIISRRDSFFAIMRDETGIALPFGYSLHSCTWSKLKSVIATDESYVRAYSKNMLVTGVNVAANLWIGDYSAEKEFTNLVQASDGIKRLGVIRADVDNLGSAFVEGFSKREGGKYETISRTAVLSRKLSIYFKQYVNVLLAEGEYQLYKDKTAAERNAVIIYSGGDDLFIVGGWDDILCFAIDLYRSFKRYTQGMLTFSAGIGLFTEKYPIAAMAAKTGELESTAKNYDGGSKDAVALFDSDNVYHWDELTDRVLGEKLELIQSYISVNDEHNKAMLYNMLELIRARDKENRLNIARLAYLLARLKPKGEDVPKQREEAYSRFSRSIYGWIQSKRDCRELVTAIYIFIYMTREREDKNEGAK